MAATMNRISVAPDQAIFTTVYEGGDWLEGILADQSAGEYVRIQESNGSSDAQAIAALCDWFGGTPDGFYMSEQDAQDFVDEQLRYSYSRYSIESFTPSEAYRRIREMAEEEKRYEEDAD